MKRIVEFPDRETVRNEAAEWIAKLDGGRLGIDLQELREWMGRSPHHLAELERTAEIWDSLEVLSACRGLVDEPKKRTSYVRWVPAALAAGLAAFAVVVWPTIDRSGREPLSVENAVYKTEVGEQRKLHLPDGSSVRMNTGSRLEVAYTDASRRIRLEQGEAYFEVSPAPGRPFEVETSYGFVTAVGTAFSVRVDRRQVEVTVSEGRVRLSLKRPEEVSTTDSLAAQVAELATVSAGQTAVFDEQLGSIQTLDPSDIVRRLAWRDRMLIFDGDTLETVIAEVSRYGPVEIVISDPALSELRIGGYFRTGETDDLLSALESGFGVRVERAVDERIYLYAADR